MHRELIINAFKRIKDTEKENTGIEVSNSAAAKLLSDFIFERKKIQFGEKSLSDYYRYAVDKEKREVIIKQPKVVEAMCELLGFKNFVEFKNAHGLNEVLTSSKQDFISLFVDFLKRNKIVLIVSVTTIIVMFFIFSINQQRWMIWEKDHYVEVKFDSEKYTIGQLKLYNENRTNYFKKIKANCETEFFDSNGEVKVWYGKNIKKELEYFTASGLHPNTGKTLDPITVYMIRKYICHNY